MLFARNNILIPLGSNEEPTYAILNPLSGSFDLLERDEYEQIAAGKLESLNNQLAEYMIERGYLFKERGDEDKLMNDKWLEFQDEIANTQTQLMLIPSYGCNIACTYCYQAGVQSEPGLISPETVDAFFDYADKTFANYDRKPFVTLFGGEPFINTPRHRAIISLIIDRCIEHGYEVAAVTNGYDLIDYIEILSRAQVKEIQVTLDGSKQIHDQRRIFANGRGTFDRIVKGIEAALQQGISINLRTVVDQENLQDMVEFAKFLDQKGWLDLPAQLFKTQIGRNYELFECYAKPQHLLSQAELWQKFSDMSVEYPLLRKFHRPEFKGIRQLVDTGNMYMASFDTCPAAKTEWVFDLHGDIYGCTASCGREEYKLGSFFPEVTLNNKAIQPWQARNINNIEECRECRYNVVCGGGCGVMAANREGRVLAPDCRPIKELLETGVQYYQQEILEMAASHDELNVSDKSVGNEPKTGFAITNLSACTCGEQDAQLPADSGNDFISGCMLCGAKLNYRNEKEPARCEICGKYEESLVTCQNGHYICDECHGQNIMGEVYKYCLTTDYKDPGSILQELFKLPGLHMHGPEYHSMVPAALVAAYANRGGIDKKPLISEAIKRGRDIKGGSCGLNGVCGAAVGAGIAYSIIKGVSPLSGDERGNGMKLTAAVLNEISQYGGPRCCKRESSLAVETAEKIMDTFMGAESAGYKCSQFKDNPDCLKKACSYFPVNNNSRED